MDAVEQTVQIALEMIFKNRMLIGAATAMAVIIAAAAAVLVDLAAVRQCILTILLKATF